MSLQGAGSVQQCCARRQARRGGISHSSSPALFSHRLWTPLQPDRHQHARPHQRQLLQHHLNAYGGAATSGSSDEGEGVHQAEHKAHVRNCFEAPVLTAAIASLHPTASFPHVLSPHLNSPFLSVADGHSSLAALHKAAHNGRHGHQRDQHQPSRAAKPGPGQREHSSSCHRPGASSKLSPAHERSHRGHQPTLRYRN